MEGFRPKTAKTAKMRIRTELYGTLIPSAVYLCAKIEKNGKNFVPTGRVIKYPTKCALFPDFPGPPVPGPGEALGGGPQGGSWGGSKTLENGRFRPKNGLYVQKNTEKGSKNGRFSTQNEGSGPSPGTPDQGLEKGPGPGVARGRPGSLPRTPGPGPGPRARAGAARAGAGSGDPGWDGGPPLGMGCRYKSVSLRSTDYPALP